MSFRPSPRTLTEFSARHPWRTIGAWAMVLALSIVLIALFLPKAMTTNSGFSNNPESRVGFKLIEDRLRGPQKDTEAVVVRSLSRNVDDADFSQYVQDLEARIQSLGPSYIETAATYYDTQA